MRRLLRWAFNGAAVVWAMLFVATCILWARTRHVSGRLSFGLEKCGLTTIYADGSRYWGERTFRGCVLEAGEVWCGTVWDVNDDAEAPGLYWSDGSNLIFSGPPSPHVSNRFGIGIQSVNDLDHGVFYSGLDVPVWAFLISFCALPVIRLIRSFAKRRIPLPGGICAACGYDLRATPDRCPECGAVPAGKAAT